MSLKRRRRRNWSHLSGLVVVAVVAVVAVVVVVAAAAVVDLIWMYLYSSLPISLFFLFGKLGIVDHAPLGPAGCDQFEEGGGGGGGRRGREGGGKGR